MEAQYVMDNTGSPSGSSGSSTSNSTISIEPIYGKIFVGGLSWDTSDQNLKKYFETFGKVKDALIITDPLTLKSRGFGFVTFSEHSSVDNVFKVPIHILDDTKIDIKQAIPSVQAKQGKGTKKLFVGGVSQETSEEEVEAYFAQYGRVERTSLLIDQQTKRHRGFGFVTFENEDVVDMVCDIHFHTIKTKKVECKKAKPKAALGTPTSGNISVIGGLGTRMHDPAAIKTLAPPTLSASASAPYLAHVQAQAAAAAAHAAFQAQSAAMAGFAMYGTYPPSPSYRYAPYGIPTLTAGIGVPRPAAPKSSQAAAISPSPHGPYQGYNFANVDMSSFRGVDWSKLYGVGMFG